MLFLCTLTGVLGGQVFEHGHVKRMNKMINMAMAYKQVLNIFLIFKFKDSFNEA